MARALRFECPGAMYHVINRGNYRSWIFDDDGAKLSFEKTLFEACERAGWILHAYCVMGNHFHLALETPEANLSSGMKWLQGVFATRFNRFRKERGSLFQGRFKSILVDGDERLSWLCHYIHLNPLRAGIVGRDRPESYRFCSLNFLGGKRGRPKPLDFGVCLDGAGGLNDTPAGRRKYLDYLRWLSEDESGRKSMMFDEMSRGWAHGTKEFKKAVLSEAKKERSAIERGESLDREQKLLVWESDLAICLDAIGKNDVDVARDLKSADWKVAVCAWMRSRCLCSNGWLVEQLNMGTESGVSRYVRELEEGKRPKAASLLRELIARIHS